MDEAKEEKKVKEIAKVLEYQLNSDKRYSYGAYPCYYDFSLWDVGVYNERETIRNI